MTDLTDLRDKRIYELASIIHADWLPPNYAAVPYLDAMATMESIDDAYGLDNGRGIISYFLSNATTWRGETARAIKAELKRRLGR